MRVKPGAGFGKSVPSRANYVDPAVEEENNQIRQLDLMLNTLHGATAEVVYERVERGRGREDIHAVHGRVIVLTSTCARRGTRC